jgi:hypothetical protein
MAEIVELRRKAEQFARLSEAILDGRLRQLFAELAVEFSCEADRLEAIPKEESFLTILFLGSTSPILRVPYHTSTS